MFAIQKNVWKNPAFEGIFSEFLDEYECVEHYLKTIEKEVPMVALDDQKGGSEEKASVNQAEL